MHHLANAVSRSELANRFGTALPHLREPDRVEIFFELAQELAEPNSEEYANVVSNRSNALRQSGRGNDVISGLTLALAKQEYLHDYHNAIVTAANFRLAAENGAHPAWLLVRTREKLRSRLWREYWRISISCLVQTADPSTTKATLAHGIDTWQRGCPWECSFCSIRPFYEEQGGSLRRLRKPKEIFGEDRFASQPQGSHFSAAGGCAGARPDLGQNCVDRPRHISCINAGGTGPRRDF